MMSPARTPIEAGEDYTQVYRACRSSSGRVVAGERAICSDRAHAMRFDGLGCFRSFRLFKLYVGCVCLGLHGPFFQKVAKTINLLNFFEELNGATV